MIFPLYNWLWRFSLMQASYRGESFVVGSVQTVDYGGMAGCYNGEPLVVWGN